MEKTTKRKIFAKGLFLRSLRMLLRQSDEIGCPVSVCRIKVDVKALGSDEADKLTIGIFNYARGFFRKSDLVFRWSRDEIIVALYGCEDSDARERIFLLRHSSLGFADRLPSSFFFGIAQSDEREFCAGRDKAALMLRAALSRMGNVY